MKKNLFSLILFPLLFAITGCDDHEKINVEPSALPPTVINAVQNALPGINIIEAESKTKGEPRITVYELEGQLINGKKYDVEIDENGSIIEIELDD